MPKLGHQLRNILCVRHRINAVGSRRLIGVAEATMVGSNSGEMFGQEREDPVPVDAVLGRTMEKEQAGPVNHASPLQDSSGRDYGIKREQPSPTVWVST